LATQVDSAWESAALIAIARVGSVEGNIVARRIARKAMVLEQHVIVRPCDFATCIDRVGERPFSKLEAGIGLVEFGVAAVGGAHESVSSVTTIDVHSRNRPISVDADCFCSLAYAGASAFCLEGNEAGSLRGERGGAAEGDDSRRNKSS